MNHSEVQFKSKRLREAAARLISGIFDYHRVGHDRRPLTFQAGGVIGEGARGREVSWRVIEKGGKVVLEIFSKNETTCRLKEGSDQVWRGRWICCERMPVELSPIKKGHKKDTKLSMAHFSLESMPDSLFLVSLPRSLSTLLYHCVRRAVGLHEPAWASAGEILNLDRFTLFQGPTHDTSRKFISPDLEPRMFYAATEFLDQLVQPVGHAYKDVVQPFVIAEWGKRRKICMIRIKRNIADVAYAMLNRNWFYPTRLFPKTKDAEVALVRGLIEADQALDSLPAQRLEFDELILDERPLRRALQTLYPKRRIRAVGFIDNQFKEMRHQVLERRGTKKHKMLTEYVAEFSPQAAAFH